MPEGAKATIFAFNILNPKDRELLYHWADSDLLVWARMAPVCGTCSRAREIKNGGPRPLCSDDEPMGLSDLSPTEQRRVDLANEMYYETCKFFARCISLAISVTLENPINSILWLPMPFIWLQSVGALYFSDAQMCMMGSARPKWARLYANFASIIDMNAVCDESHPHVAWGKTFDEHGRGVYATRLQAEYPRRFCFSLVHCVAKQLQQLGMSRPPQSFAELSKDKAFEMQAARIFDNN